MSIAVPTHVARTAEVKSTGAVSGTNTAQTTIVASPAAAQRFPPRSRGESATAAPTSKPSALVGDEKYAKSRQLPTSTAVSNKLPTPPATTADQSPVRGRANY